MELKRDIPKTIGPPSDERPVIVFTDGACETELTSIGGVLFPPTGRVQCFGLELPTALIDSWKSNKEQLQVIGQAEILPVLVAKQTWKEQLRGRRVIFFIDNESARIALVRAYSPVLASLRILMACLKSDQDLQSKSWYARVPTFSNIADGPSRLEFTKLLKDLDAEIVAPATNPLWAQGVGFELGDLRTLRY